jgi:hypothetical protein
MQILHDYDITGIKSRFAYLNKRKTHMFPLRLKNAGTQ